jgi:uncharacterized protein
MNRSPRLVFDTGVLVSALLFARSVPGTALKLAEERGRILISADTILELQAVLRRPKFDRYVSLDKREQFVALIIELAELIVVERTIVRCRDPKDDKFLSLGISGNADYIISGDADLIVLNPFEGIAILRPAELLALLGST